jgi:GWxTD domain-containing protein
MKNRGGIKFGVLMSLLLFQYSAYGQGELLAKNYKHLYDPQAEIKLEYKVVNLEDRSRLFLRITIRHNRTRIDDLAITYAYLNRHNESLIFSTDTIPLPNFWINNIRNQHYFNFEVQNPNQKKILVFRLLNKVTQNEFYFDIQINPDAEFLNSGIFLKRANEVLPYFREYSLSNEPFQIVDYKSKDSIHYIYRYENDFPISSPPFSADGDAIRKDLKIDSAFMIKTGQSLSLKNAGLYFAQQDTSGVNGLAFRNEIPFFPRKTSHNELIESLVYFCTNSEMSKLLSANNKKTAFEDYWLDVAQTPDKAQKIIRNYYRRIRQANEFFTAYKQGWKTDKGMIYVVFGPPDFVYKDGKKEKWIYERTSQLPEISFEFQKVMSIFTHDHYVLIRKRSYQQLWYKVIDLWRKGQIEI